MYGIWFLIVFAGAGAVLLVIALASAAWAPVLAVLAGLGLIGALILRSSARRTSQVGREHAAAREDERRADKTAAGGIPRSGAPASGEG